MARSAIPAAKEPLVFRLSGMTCADCAAQFERSLRALEGVARVRLNFGAAKLEVWGSVSPAAIVRRADEAGFEAVPVGAGDSAKTRSSRRRSLRVWLTLLSGCALVAAAANARWEFAADPRIEWALLVAAVATGGAYSFRSAYYALRRGAVEMNVLMSVATGGAVIIGQWFEAAALIFLFALGELVETRSLDGARRSVVDLARLAPAEATVERDGAEARIPAVQLKEGDVCIVRPGERVPADGRVVAGESVVDESAVTGLSIPVDKGPGSALYAGSMNGSGTLRFSVTCSLQESTLARTVAFVEEALGRKSPLERFVDQFCRVYTPAMMILALGTAAIPPLLLGEPFPPWIYRGLALLLLSSPYALTISTPAALVSALSHAARSGLLIKGGAEVEALAIVDTVAFGKTGVLTKGRFYVDEVIPLAGWDEERVIAVAAALERGCEHPIGRAIVAAAEERGLEAVADGVVVRTGLGVVGRVEESTYRVGSLRFLESEGVVRLNGVAMAREREQQGKTVVGLAEENLLVGLIVLADPLKEEVRRAVRRLRRLGGIETIALLTGESRESARVFAAHVGIAEVRSELLPGERAMVIQAWQHQGRKVAVVGDRENDAAAMAQADVAIALGGVDADAGAQRAHIVLMNDDLTRLPYAIALARRAVSVMRQNLHMAVGFKAAALGLLLAGQLPLWMAVTADMGAALLVTANGLRLLRRVRVPAGKERSV